MRTRRLDVNANFKNKYQDVTCPNCTEEDTQSHLLFCDKLVDGSSIVMEVPKYSDIFGDNPEEILKVTRIISKNFKLRNQLKTQ